MQIAFLIIAQSECHQSGRLGGKNSGAAELSESLTGEIERGGGEKIKYK